MPLIDPDVLSVQDLRTPNPGNPAYDLWKARQDDLAAHAASLDRLRTGQRTQQAGFDKIVSTIAPIPELLALAEQRRQGGAIDGQLRARHLPLPAFLHLMRVRELAVAGSVLDSEWADVYAVIVQFRKVGLYAAWRRQEQQKGLILGPDAFQLSDPAGSPAPALAAWRATSQGRQAWRRTLEARVQQELTLTQAIQAAVSAAEEDALPVLREACLAAITGDRDAAIVAERLTRELGIDCREQWSPANDPSPAGTADAAGGVVVPADRSVEDRTAGPRGRRTRPPGGSWHSIRTSRTSRRTSTRNGSGWGLRHLERGHPGLRLPGVLPVARAAPAPVVHQRRRGRWTRPPRTSS